MTTAESFRQEIEDYLSQTRTPAATFGKAVVGDPSFVRDIRAGRMPGLRLVEKVQRYIADNPPAQTADPQPAEAQ